MSQEFPLDIADSPLSYNLEGYFHPHQNILKGILFSFFNFTLKGK